MKNILFSLLFASSLMVHADVSYGSFGLENGDIDVDGDGFDVSAYQFSLLSSSGNVIFSTGVASGTVDDVYGYDLDFVTQGISLGYAFGSLETGSFVLGASYSRAELQNPGSSNIKTNDTEPYVGYAKLSGEGIDYRVSISDGLFDATAIIPLGDNDDWRATLGFANADDIDSLSFGVAYKF
tara:strand:+ start:244 stop:789 length:546 start_codon:yes stop_codon:yes gene_type:complete